MEGLRWYGENDTIDIGPFRFQGSLFYTAPGSRSAEPSAVLLGKRFQAPPTETLPFQTENHSLYRFYGGYAGLSMVERWGYLSWLSDGRSEHGLEGYLLLYIQGLERRAMEEGQDITAIWHEVWRLLSNKKEPRFSFNHAANQLLWFLIGKFPDLAPLEYVQEMSRGLSRVDYWNPDAADKLSLLLWWCVRQTGELPIWMACQCARVSLEARQTIVEERVAEEMRQLCELRIRARWGEFVPIKLPPKARRRMKYRPHNPSLFLSTVSWPDPLKLYAEWSAIHDELADIYNDCQQELRPMALLLGKEGVSRSSFAVWQATPAELRQTEHPVGARLEALGGASLRSSGFSATHVGLLAQLFDLPARDSVTPLKAKQLASALQSCGYGIEPDSRLTGRSYGWNEPAVLYRLPVGLALEQEMPTEPDALAVARYQSCTFVLKLAYFIAQSGGEVPIATRRIITNQLAALFAWSPLDRLRYRAAAGLCLWHAVEKTELRAPAKGAAFDKAAVRQLLLEIVAQDGRVDGAQEEALRLAWKRLGLEPRSFSGDIDTLSSQGVIFFGTGGVPGRGEKIPPPPPIVGTQPEFQLDREALAALMADTRNVQAALNRAMALEDEVEEVASLSEEAPEISVASKAEAFPGLSPRFTPFLQELLEQDDWPGDAAQEMARRHAVMLSGAVEAVNEWAFETFDAQLIWEDGDNLSVERALLK